MLHLLLLDEKATSAKMGSTLLLSSKVAVGLRFIGVKFLQLDEVGLGMTGFGSIAADLGWVEGVSIRERAKARPSRPVLRKFR